MTIIKIVKNFINKVDKYYTNFCIALYFGARKILLKFDLIEY